MRIHSRVAVGSPTFRLASFMALTLGLILALGAAVAVGASLLPTPVIVVAQDGSGTVKTIADGVAMAQDGDTVLVRPGTYLETITITEDITLRGDGDRKAVIIEFAADGPTHPIDDEPMAYGILLDGSTAHVANLTLHGRPDGAGATPLRAVIIDGGAPVIEQIDVILDDDPYPDYAWAMRGAFEIQGASSALIRDSTWDGYTRVLGLADSPTFEHNTVSAQRIAIWAGEATILDNTFLDGAGILFCCSAGGIAENNDIVDGWVIVGEGAHSTIRNNRIRQPRSPDESTGGRSAAVQIGIGTPIVEGNTISDSPYGIEIVGFGAKPQVTGNAISGSINAAIIVDLGAAPTIDGNVIEKNGTGIEVVGTSTTPVITGNTLCDNGTHLTVPEGSTLTLDGNTACGAQGSATP